MHRKKGFAVWLFLAVAPSWLWATAALALVEKMDTPQLANRASRILIGTVTDKVSRWEAQGEGRVIWTIVTLSIEHQIKGIGPETLTLRVPGGTVDGITEWVSDAPEFEPGERAVLFLQEPGFPLVGWKQGKFTIRDNKVMGLNLPLYDFVHQIRSHLGEVLPLPRSLEKGRDAPSFPEPAQATRGGPPGGNDQVPAGKTLNPQGTLPSPETKGETTAASWTSIMTEGFEGAFPSAGWNVYGGPTWDDTNFKAASGSKSAWCARGGAGGLDPAGGSYANNMSAWMVYGPFELSDASDAELIFSYWNISESNYDYFSWMASTDGINFYGYQVSGNSSGWQSVNFDLTGVPTLGDLRGLPEVWIGFHFRSDGSATFQGAFVDDIVLQKSLAGSVPSISGISPSKASAGTATNVTITGSNFGPTKGPSNVEFFYRSGQPKISAPVVSWSDTEVVCQVPTGLVGGYSASAGSGPVTVTTGGGTSNGYNFTVSFGYGGIDWGDSNPVVSYRINENNPDSTGEGAAVQAAAQEWNTTGASAFTLQYAGTTSATSSSRNGVNEIFWGNASGAIALSTCWYSGPTILECDIVFESSLNWGVGVNYDVQNIATHELGHWMNLRDLYGDAGGGNDADKTMYGFGSSGETKKRTLHADDIAGIRWIYCTATTPPATITVPASDCDGSYAVSWGAVSGASSYEVQRATNVSFSGATSVYTGAATNFNETGRPAGSYWYRVRASSNCGTSNWTSGGPVAVGSGVSAPATISVPSNDCDGSYAVSWSTVSEATSYELQRATDAGFTTAVTVFSGGAAVFNETGRPAGSYWYRVRAMGSCGNSGWTVATPCAVGAPPPVPASVTYPASDTDGSFSVSWAGAGGATNYILQRATDAAFTSPTTVYTGAATSWNQTALSPGSYYYRVGAGNACGTSGWRTGGAISVSGVGFVTSVNGLTVPEGGMASFQVKLNGQPLAAVTAMVSGWGGDADIAVLSGGTLVFGTGNWDTYQTVTLAAAEDGDTASGVATIRLSGAGLNSKDITATEGENDLAATEDLSGTWYLYGRASGGPWEGWWRGTLTLDAAGSITASAGIDSEGNPRSFIGGNLTLSGVGVVGGSGTLSTGRLFTLTYGKTDSALQTISSVYRVDTGEIGELVLVRGGGSFAASDLNGTWYLLGSATAGPPWEGWFHGTITSDATGIMTSGSWDTSDGLHATLAGGSFTLDAAGVLGGTASLSGGQTMTLAHGKMHPDKGAITCVYYRSDGELGWATLVKGGGSFAATDLEGAWYLFGLSTAAPPWEGWLYGALRVEATGLLSGGSFKNSSGALVRFTSGSFSLSAAGEFGGTATLSNKRSIAFASGKMHPDKGMISAVYTRNDGEVGQLTLLKAEDDLVAPSEGTLGTEFRITGTNFGASPGKVLLGAYKCAVVQWTDNVIQCRIGKPVPPGMYNVTILPKKTSPVVLPGAFTARIPDAIVVSPAHGVAGQTLTVQGRFFGSKYKKSSKLLIGTQRCPILSWAMDPASGASVVQCHVPSGLVAGSYDLTVVSAAGSTTVPGAFSLL